MTRGRAWDARLNFLSGGEKQIPHPGKPGFGMTWCSRWSCVVRIRLIGTIEVGKFADIVVVHGGPLKDVAILQKVDFVMKAK